jgi:hypothetical protein
MSELFYWKEIERRARAAQALAMLHNRTDTTVSSTIGKRPNG